MKKTSLLVIIAVLLSFAANAQNDRSKDQEAIKSMCGCYEVGFNFAETFNYASDSSYVPSKVKHEKALEWVQLLEDEENKIVLQHLLLVGSPSKPHVIKHWRQDWLFENTDFYMFDKNKQWKFIRVPKSEVKGQWTQKVYQVDDSPRYEGSASWVYVDGKTFWENTTDAPLPRREHTQRNDYNVTIRRNRHEITPQGWIHDQDNDKIIRQSGKEDILLAQEKGYNTYVKVDDSRCKAAQDWWAENQELWKLVRNNWDKVFARKKDLKLTSKVDDKMLFEYLFKLAPSSKNEEVEKIIQSFVVN